MTTMRDTSQLAPGPAGDRGRSMRPVRPQVIPVLLRQQRLWQQGERPPVETFLEQEPALRDDPEAVLDLIYNEILLREERGETPRIEEYLPRITCPILVIQGEKDEYGTIAHVQSIQRTTPKAEALLLPGCGHSPHRERPAEVLAAITQFVEYL